MVYLRSKAQAPSRKSCGSSLREVAASAAVLSIHFLPSARQSAASAGSALILSSRKTLASTFLFLSVASGLGSAASAAGETARPANAPTRQILRIRLRETERYKEGPLKKLRSCAFVQPRPMVRTAN